MMIKLLVPKMLVKSLKNSVVRVGFCHTNRNPDILVIELDKGHAIHMLINWWDITDFVKKNQNSPLQVTSTCCVERLGP